MIIYKRILGFLSAFLLVALMGISHYFPHWVKYFIILSIIILLFYFWRLKNRFITHKLLIKYFLISLFFLLSVWLFFIIIDSLIIKYIVLSGLLIYLIIVFDVLFKKIYQNQDIRQQLIFYIDLICFWFISYFLFYSQVFFRMGIFINSLILFISCLILIIIRFYWHKISIKKEILHILGISVILIEIYIITSFLAFSFYLSTLILWLWYYLILDYFVDKVKDGFIWRNKLKTLIFVLILFVFLLISSKL